MISTARLFDDFFLTFSRLTSLVLQQQGSPCNCETGYEGPHCEFKKGSVPSCDLQCQNDGHCELGLGDDVTKIHDLQHLFQDTGYQKCVCPPGYGGTYCEVKRSECGSHHCYNGGTCIPREDPSQPSVTKYHCDCTTAHDADKSYAGRFCQFESSSFCSKNEDQNGHLFCTNGGTCRENM